MRQILAGVLALALVLPVNAQAWSVQEEEGEISSIAAKRECEANSGADQRLEGATAEECKADELADTAAHQAEINAEDARLEGEYEAAETRARETPVKRLSVRVTTARGTTTQSPGATYIGVTTTPWAHVSIKLSRYGHATYDLETGPSSADAYDMAHGENCGTPETWTMSCDSSAPEPIPATFETGIRVDWTCARPGGTYSYVVTARSNVGATLTRRGTFTPVSVGRCDELRHREQEAEQRNERKFNEELSRLRRGERERRERWERNCRAELGTPITLQTSEGSERACRAPGGGLLEVPE